ncbi:MAG: Asp-tRNA(Asn)/Glu-tRNA(Gln) amidotransferase GatCAB subunit B, partial [Candidatus Roizmanbacteria bacterium]
LQKALEDNEKKAEQTNLMQTNEGKESLNLAINKVIEANGDAVENYKKGKTTVIMFLVGQVMKEMKGQARAEIVKSTLEKYL